MIASNTCFCVMQLKHGFVNSLINDFLLFQIICDELSFVLRSSQPACTLWSSEKEINSLWTQLSDINAQLQVDSRLLT